MYHVKFENEHIKFDVTQVSTHPVKFDMQYVKFVMSEIDVPQVRTMKVKFDIYHVELDNKL